MQEGGRKIDPSAITVLGGVIDIDDAASGEEQRVEAIFIHDDYESQSLTNDIALLKLVKPQKAIDRTLRNVVSIPAPSDTRWVNTAYLSVRVQGWGRTEFGHLSSNLLEAVLPLVEQEECHEIFRQNGHLMTDGQVCAGFVSGQFDSCQGDSGGPLVYRPISESSSDVFSSSPVLVGVVSWGIGCATPGLFGIYTSTLFYREWMARVVSSYYRSQAEEKASPAR